MFSTEPIAHFYKQLVSHDFPAAVEPLSTYMFFSEFQVNLQEFTYLNLTNFGPAGEQFWSKGLYIQHIFQLAKECSSSMMCKFMRTLKQPAGDLHVKGFLNLKSMTLSGDLPDLKLASNIVLKGVKLNLPIIKEAVSQGGAKQQQ